MLNMFMVFVLYNLQPNERWVDPVDPCVEFMCLKNKISQHRETCTKILDCGLEMCGPVVPEGQCCEKCVPCGSKLYKVYILYTVPTCHRCPLRVFGNEIFSQKLILGTSWSSFSKASYSPPAKLQF